MGFERQRDGALIVSVSLAIVSVSVRTIIDSTVPGPSTKLTMTMHKLKLVSCKRTLSKRTLSTTYSTALLTLE